MRKAKVYIDSVEAGILTEIEFKLKYKYEYYPEYSGFEIEYNW